MMPHPELLLPDDEHYYFGVELPWSPEAVQGRLLRKPEFLCTPPPLMMTR